MPGKLPSNRNKLYSLVHHHRNSVSEEENLLKCFSLSLGRSVCRFISWRLFLMVHTWHVITEAKLLLKLWSLKPTDARGQEDFEEQEDRAVGGGRRVRGKELPIPRQHQHQPTCIKNFLRQWTATPPPEPNPLHSLISKLCKKELGLSDMESEGKRAFHQIPENNSFYLIM